jgi:hypothetical protein
MASSVAASVGITPKRSIMFDVKLTSLATVSRKNIILQNKPIFAECEINQ